jgi:hypothetical protein
MVYNDIKENGPKEEEFTKGIMSIVYKKKDNREIENYHLS